MYECQELSNNNHKFSYTATTLISLDAQLQSPQWPVCPDREITFVCQVLGIQLTWSIEVNGMTGRQLQITYGTSSQLGISRPFDGDSFGFMTTLVRNRSSVYNSTLTVTADRRLHGTVVECTGLFMIQEVLINIKSKSDLHPYI